MEIGNKKIVGSQQSVWANIGLRLKSARKINGWSLREAAEKLTEQGKKITKQGLQRYEKGEVHLDSTQFIMFSKLYNVPVDYFNRKPVEIKLGEIRWFKLKFW